MTIDTIEECADRIVLGFDKGYVAAVPHVVGGLPAPVASLNAGKPAPVTLRLGKMAACIQHDRSDRTVAHPVLVSISKRIGGGAKCAGQWILQILDHDQGAIEHLIDAIIGKMHTL